MNQSSPESAHERLDSLDGWRTISVALVIIDHLGRWSSIGTTDSRFAVFDSYGHLGVQIFFVISGFVICRGLEKETSGFGQISIAAFYVRRFFRILPPLLFFLVGLLTLWSFGLVDYQISQLPRAMTFTCNIWNGCGGYVANHLWSLSVEEQFYLVFPVLFVLLAKKRKVVLGALWCGFPFAILALGEVRLGALASYLSDFLCIAAGIVCAEYEQEIRRFCRRLPTWTPVASFAALLFLATIAGPNIWSTLARFFLLPALIALGLVTTVAQPSAVSRLLSTRWMTAIGRSSYTIYLWQQLATAPYSGQGYVFYVLSVPGCVGFSCLSYFFVERRLIRMGAKVSARIRSKKGASKLRTANVTS
jgi:peptidoglycan/LPS O-acetylase OafA/YrhL